MTEKSALEKVQFDPQLESC